MTENSYPAWQKRRLGILCWIVIIAILIATLWPFNFLPANKVRWLHVRNGVQFGGRGVIVSNGLLRMPQGNPETSCSLEIFLEPAGVENSTTILGLYTGQDPNQFLIRQWTDGLVVIHEGRNAQNRPKRAQIDVDHAFQAGRPVLVTIVSGQNGTIVYLDGIQARVFPKFLISQPELSGQLALGTAPEDYQPWSGEVLGLALYSKELTATEVAQHFGRWISGNGSDSPDLVDATDYYPFNERHGTVVQDLVLSGPNLEIPRWFKVPHKAFLKSPIREFSANWDYVNDVWRNILGFVPLGLALCAYFRARTGPRQAVLYAVLTGCLLSLLIEILQVYVPPRNSGITDIITNTLGTFWGAMIVGPKVVQVLLETTVLVKAPPVVSDASRST